MDANAILPVVIAGVAAIVGSLITAYLLRRSNKEANDTNAFKVVTDQLFALNKELKLELDEVKSELSEVRATQEEQAQQLKEARQGWSAARRVNASLAGYIKKLLAAWPVGSTPPAPDEVLDWEAHL